MAFRRRGMAAAGVGGASGWVDNEFSAASLISTESVDNSVEKLGSIGPKINEALGSTTLPIK
jgi:hypothetical protein